MEVINGVAQRPRRFNFRVALKMALSRHQSFSITFQAANHECDFQRRDDESRRPFWHRHQLRRGFELRDRIKLLKALVKALDRLHMLRAERFARRFNCSPDRLGPRSAIFFMGRRPGSLDLAPHMTPPEGKSLPVLGLSWTGSNCKTADGGLRWNQRTGFSNKSCAQKTRTSRAGERRAPGKSPHSQDD